MVASIISAFGNGRDLFRRMAGKKSKRKGREPTSSEEEAWLQDSLHHRPLEIQRSYQHHVSRHGHRYEIGDSIAHTSLAHTLLMLNSGLIKLINQALSKDSKDNLSRRSLLSLSEVAAADTLNALSQLSLRLNSQSHLTLQAPPRPPKEKPQRKEDVSPDLKLKGGKGSASPKKRPGPTPLLIRGGWVRPKTSSVVSTSSSKSGKSSTSKHQRSKSEPVVPKSSSKPPQSPTKAPKPTEDVAGTHEPSVLKKRSSLDVRHSQRPPSMLIVPSDLFLPQSQGQAFQEHESPPPRPPKIPLHSRPNPNLHARPKSSGTMRSASTKIGEIPEDRFSRTLKPVEEQSYDPRLVQYLMSTPDGMAPEQPKKRGRGFRFWKKDETQAVAAY